MTRVAMIGLGRMGGPMADHVARAGHEVRVFDVAEAAMAPRVAAGAAAATSPADAARAAEVVCVVVLDDAQTESVVAGTDGVLEVLGPGAVVVVHSTVTAGTIEALATLAAARGVEVIDAGISGGEPGAAKGNLLTMVGATDRALTLVRPVLDCYSREVVHAGPRGAGMALKLARNATGYVMMSAVHEAMELAQRAGVDLALLRHVLGETGVFEQGLAVLAMGGPQPLGPDDPPAMREILRHTLLLADKDLTQALDLADRLGAPTPIIERVRTEFHRSVRL